MLRRLALLAVFLVCVWRPAVPQTATAGSTVIEGDVVDGDTGKGIPGARVKLGYEEDEVKFAFADGAGHFRFTGVPGGKNWWMTAQQIGYMGPHDRPSSSGGGSAMSGQAGPVRITLIRYAVITGTVTDSAGAPISTAEVNVMRKVPVEARVMQRPERRLPDGKNRLDVVGHLYTDQRGVYRCARLPGGTYYVEARRPSGGYSEDQRMERATYFGGALEFAGAKPIEATAGQTIDKINVELVKRAGFRVSDRVVKPSLPESGASSEPVFTSISLQSLSGEAGYSNSYYAGANEDRFEIEDVLPGRYTLRAVIRPRYGRPEADKAFAAALQTIEVGQGNVSGLTVAPQPPHDLPGTVRFEQRCAPQTARLQINHTPGLSTFFVDADGSFVLKDLIPGAYWLSALTIGDRFGRLGAIRLGDRESRDSFQMSADDYGPLIVEVVCPRGKISGEVQDANGNPAGNATVIAESASTPGDLRSGPVSGPGRAFEFQLPPGVYNLFACTHWVNDPGRAAECQKAPDPVTLTDGGKPHVTLALPAAQQKGSAQ